MNIFNTFFYQPLLNVLILLYRNIPGNDFGVAVILLTLIIKFLLLPLNLKSIKSQKAISQIQSEIEQAKNKFKDNKEKMVKETMGVYQKANLNPFSGLFLILLQVPVLIALYKVFVQGILIDGIEPKFLTIDLAQPNFILAGVAGILQFFQTKAQIPKIKKKSQNLPNFANMFQKQMLYFFPAFTFFILLKLPSALALYLIVSTVFTILETIYIQKRSDFPGKSDLNKSIINY